MNDTNFERAGEAHISMMQTQTKPAPLTAAHHYRVGMEVEVDTLNGKQIATINGIDEAWIKYKLKEPFATGRPHYATVTGGSVRVDRPQDIRPVLRPITDVTDAEWQAFWPGCRVGRERDSDWCCDYVELVEGDIDPARISIWPNGEIICFDVDLGRRHPRPLILADLIDYLDQIGADIRGYLLDGRAVAKTTLTP